MFVYNKDLRLNPIKETVHTMMKKIILGTILCASLGALSCGNGAVNQPDVSDVQLPIKFENLYKDMAAIDTNDIGNQLVEMSKKYPTFFDFYIDTLAGLGVHKEYTTATQNVRLFLTHKDYRALNDTVVERFKDLKPTNDAITKTLKLIKHYDAGFELPTEVYYFVSGLNQWNALTHFDTQLGIGLDMFLGPDFGPYQSIGIPQYALIQFTEKSIPVWAAKAIYSNKHTFVSEKGNTLLDMMLQRGKEQYFLTRVCPDVSPALRLGFTEAQYKWCEENQQMIYNFFVQSQYLYETNLQKVMRYVLDGPSAAGLPPESPANIGTYLGWKIIEAYAQQENKDMKGVLSAPNDVSVLKAAKYKP